MNARRYILFIIVSLSAAAGCRNNKDLEQLPPPTGSGAPPAVSMPSLSNSNPVEAAGNSNRLIVTGTSRPLREAKVGPKGSGVIVSLPVEEGDRVKKGQLLFRLESANQALAVSQAEAALSSAMVAESTAKTEMARVKALHERGSVAPAVYDGAKAQLDAAQAAVKQARAALARARRATADTAVHAPISGVVAKRLASVGDTVTMMPPTVVLIIQDISKLEVRGHVPETMLKQLRPGSELLVRFPAVEAERTVSIERINPSVDPMTRTIEIVAMVENRDDTLKAGMLVELDFSRPEQEKASGDKPTGDEIRGNEPTKTAATAGSAKPAGAEQP